MNRFGTIPWAGWWPLAAASSLLLLGLVTASSVPSATGHACVLREKTALLQPAVAIHEALADCVQGIATWENPKDSSRRAPARRFVT